MLKAIQQSNRFLALYLLKNGASCSDDMLFLAIQKNLPDVVDYMLKHSIDNTALQNCIQRMLKQKKITGLPVSSLAHMLKHKHLELLSLDIADSALNLALINEHYEIIP